MHWTHEHFPRVIDSLQIYTYITGPGWERVTMATMAKDI